MENPNSQRPGETAKQWRDRVNGSTFDTESEIPGEAQPAEQAPTN